jgi:metal-responsive CopG/Arc/MetJ family transcriptional regulator
MHSPAQLKKQQVGLRLPVYLVEKLDELTEKYGLNRSDIITESIKAYIAEQEAREFYENFEEGCRELREVLNDPQKREALQTLDEFLDEL